MKGLERIVLAYLRPQTMDYWLPDGEATSCEIRQHSVIWSCAVQKLHRGCAVSILVHPVQLRFSIQLQVTDSAVVTWIIREAEGVQSTSKWFCEVVWEGQLLLYVRKMREIQFRRKKTYMAHVYRGTGCDVVGCKYLDIHINSGWADQHRGCTQEVDE